MMRRQEKREVLSVKKQELEQLMAAGGKDKAASIIAFMGEESLNHLIAWDSELQTVCKMAQISELEMKYGETHQLLEFPSGIKAASDLYADLRNICLRIENDIPEAFWPTGIDGEKILISGVAYYKIIEMETKQKENNIHKLANMLSQKGMLIAVIRLLQLGFETYKEEQLALQLADCWLSCGRPGQAYQVLAKLEEPSEEIRKLRQELEKVAGNENIP